MRSWCFDSQESGGVYDREYGSADIREVVHKIVGNGIFMDTDTSLQVAVDSGLQVAIQPGNCFINGAFGAVDAAETLTFDASASGRYDIVVARFDLSLSYRSIRLAVIKGTEGSSTAPTPTQTASVYDLQLAKVNIRSGATSILQTDITDTRTDSTVCGIVNGVSAQAAALQEQINTVSATKQDKTNSLGAETVIEDADSFPFYDASASAHKKTLWSNIKAKLKAYFDTLYVGATTTSLTVTEYDSSNYYMDYGYAKFYPIINKVYVQLRFYAARNISAGANFDAAVISGVTTTTTPALACCNEGDASCGADVLSNGRVNIYNYQDLVTNEVINVCGWFTPTSEVS